MKRAVSLVDDAATLEDGVLVRKITECRQTLRTLSRYRGEQVRSSCALLELAIESLQAEVEDRALPLDKDRALPLDKESMFSRPSSRR